MNVICAYCGVQFAEDRLAIFQDEDAIAAEHKWGVFVTALLLPVVGLVAGCSYIASADRSKRSTGRLWLIAGLCSSAVYAAVLMS
jgi:hypothetical protein